MGLPVPDGYFKILFELSPVDVSQKPFQIGVDHFVMAEGAVLQLGDGLIHCFVLINDTIGGADDARPVGTVPAVNDNGLGSCFD